MEENPGFENTHKFYEYSAEEVQQTYFKKLHIAKKLYSTPTKNGIYANLEENIDAIWFLAHQG
jgi:hypothetical protein